MAFLSGTGLAGGHCTHCSYGAARDATSSSTHAEYKDEVNLHELTRFSHVNVEQWVEAIGIVVLARTDFAIMSPPEDHSSEPPRDCAAAEWASDELPAVANDLGLSNEVSQLQKGNGQSPQI